MTRSHHDNPQRHGRNPVEGCAPSQRWVAAACTAALLGLASGCAPKSPTGAGTSFRGGTGQPVVVQTARVVPQPLQESVLLTGELSSPEAVELRPMVSGRLETLQRADGTRIEEGCTVRRGETVALLDRRESAAQLALADAAVKTAEVTVQDAARERQRAENLFRQGSLTEQRRDAAATAHDLADAALLQAKARRELAAVQHDETVIRAPFDGVVVERHVDPGDLVSPSSPLLRVAAMDPLRFLVDLPVRLLPRIEPEVTTVDVRTDVYPDKTFRGTVRRIFPTVDMATRTVRTELLIPNPATNGAAVGPLRSGMYATATVVLTTRDNAIAVPFDTVVRNSDEHFVFVVTNGVAEARPVVLGVRTGSLLEIAEGLKGGEELVVVGQHKLTNGSAVRAAGAAGATPAAPEAPR